MKSRSSSPGTLVQDALFNVLWSQILTNMCNSLTSYMLEMNTYRVCGARPLHGGGCLWARPLPPPLAPFAVYCRQEDGITTSDGAI